MGSNVAVCYSRALFSEPVVVQVPLAGSYSSAPGQIAAAVIPPRDQDLAIGQQRRRVKLRRAVFSEPVVVQVPLAGSYSSAPARWLLPS